MRRLVPWAVLAVLAAIFAAGSSLSGRNGHSVVFVDAVWLFSFATFAIVGGLIVRARPDNPIGWLFIGAGLGTALASSGRDLGTYLGVGWLEPASLVLFGLAWLAALAYPLFLFPDGRLPSRRWRPALWALHALAAGQSVAVVLGQWGVVSVCEYASVGFTVLGLSSLVLRWRRASGTIRAQLSWLALAGLLIVALIAAQAWLLVALGPGDTRSGLLEAVAVGMIPVATAVAILRHRLFDIELVLRRSLVYAALTAIVLTAYAGSVTVAARYFDTTARAGASLVASALVAVALSPVKERLDRVVEWALFGDRRRPERPLAALAARLEVARGDAMREAAQTVRGALRLSYVRIEFAGSADAVQLGESIVDAHEVELVSHGTVEGRLRVGRGPGEEFDARDRALLADLSRQVALLARATRLTADVRRGRERLVHAREQERVRLRRDLHDGLGPVLAGLTLQVDALRPSVDASGLELLDRIKAALRRCVADVRRAVDGLRPADLDELGLAGVVGEQARSLSASGVTVNLHCGEQLAVSPAVEVAAYRIVTEALTNVVRHAGARTCWISIERVGSTVEVRVEDDGAGIAPAAPAGVGLHSMRERADELGGTLEVVPRQGGGTGVRAVIPVEVPA